MVNPITLPNLLILLIIKLTLSMIQLMPVSTQPIIFSITLLVLLLIKSKALPKSPVIIFASLPIKSMIGDKNNIINSNCLANILIGSKVKLIVGASDANAPESMLIIGARVLPIKLITGLRTSIKIFNKSIIIFKIGASADPKDATNVFIDSLNSSFLA